MAARNNPGGGVKQDKLMRDALLLELKTEVEIPKSERRPSGPSKETHLRRIARKLVKLAGDGAIEAIREVNNRVDGKAVQPLANDVDNPLLPEEGFKVTFIKASDAK